MAYCCENCGWSEIFGSPIMCNYNGHRTFRDECCPAWKPKEVNEQQAESVDAFIQWCADSPVIAPAVLNGIKYWVEKYKEFVSKGR